VSGAEGQSLPVGEAVDWTPPAHLEPLVLQGRWVRLEPLSEDHAGELERTVCDAPAKIWTYLYDDPPTDCAAYVRDRMAVPGLVSLAIRPLGGPAPGVASGIASWLREDSRHGTVEVGGIVLGPGLQRTTAATEAMWLMMRHAFERGYRRYEWKCDALNAASRAAASRLGFSYEGTFRQAAVYKGRNRDTAWFSVTDGDWAALAPAFAAWLDVSNFDDPVAGTGQRQPLSRLTAAALPHRGTAVPYAGTRTGPA
jgi:RimJ/RimL family protein N-acetyltransferase